MLTYRLKHTIKATLMVKELFVYEFKLKDGHNISENFGSFTWPFRRFLAFFLVLFVALSFSTVATNSAVLAAAVIEEPNFDINYAKIEETFSRRKLIYQRSCSLIEKLITLNKKGLTNKGYSLNFTI
jgi:hypothetical protein